MKPVLPSVHAAIVDDMGRPTPEFFRWMQALSTASPNWDLPTGTASRATFNTATVTTEELAQRFMASLLDERSRGQI